MRGREFDLLSPFEEIEPVIHDLQPDRASPLRNWLVYHQAFLLEQALGSDAMLAVQPGRLRIEPYQLVPVLRAIQMSRVRLMLADGVGLGKTIQAGLVITELVARRIAHRILIVSPAGPLLDQWKMEMSERFGLRLDVIDRARLEEIRRSSELGANPFDHISLGLVSIDFLKQERILDQLERASYDIVVIDEAHHCTDPGSLSDHEDSQRRRLAEVLARRCDAFLLLTATPHDGNDRSFASLCELLDPSLVDGRGQLRGEGYRGYVVRRLKKHIKDPNTGQDLFKDRIVTPCAVKAAPRQHPHFIALQKALLELVAPELRRAFRARRYNDVLSFIALLKRSVSTVEACRSTLAVVADRFQKLLTEGAESQESRRQRLRTLREFSRKIARFGTTSEEEEKEAALLEAEDLAQQLVDLEREVRSGSRAISRKASVVESLDQLVELATAAAAEDPKILELVKLIAAIREEEPGANILVYTEYTTSQMAVVKRLKEASLGDILSMSGEDDEKARTKVTGLFRARDNIVLVSTDAAAEGLNLHQRCHHLIHLELPFNPNRLEQRNGRIDRYGQQKVPMVKYVYLRGTFEERILLRLIAKYERQRARLTFVPNTLGLTTATDASTERLLKGLMDEDTKLFGEEETLFEFTSGREEDGADEPTRELLEEVERSLQGFERAARTHSWLGEAGLNAEVRLLAEADRARHLGNRSGSVELAQFVTDAILMDGGEMKGNINEDFFCIALPPAWVHGIEELPGWDPVSRSISLTTRLHVVTDGKDRAVGFLGRAHPLVRRALDRVRNISYGSSAQSGLDPRVSVAEASVEEPTLLYTFLGQVSSEAGRELERVLAVTLSRSGKCEIHESPDSWLPLADAKRGARTKDVWTNTFKYWASGALDRAEGAAAETFRPLADEFIRKRREGLEVERSRQKEWLRQRSSEITEITVQESAQPTLFDSPISAGASSGVSSPAWRSLTDPAERLAAFSSDPTQLPSKRSEAEGVLRIFKQRILDLDVRLNLGEPGIVPLGLLMLIPEATCGA